MITVTEQKDKLFQQYPAEDLRLDGLQSCQKLRYGQYTNIIGKIASAVTLVDERAFNDASKEYIKFYEELKKAGFCISENYRKKRKDERYKLRNAVTRIENDLETMRLNLISLSQKIETTQKLQVERTAELQVCQAKLDEFDKEEK